MYAPALDAHDQRQRLALSVREPGREHDIGAFRALEKARRGQPLHDLGQQRLVVALPDDVVVREQHPELSVEVGPVLLARLDQAVPQRDRLGVAALELDDPGAGPFGEVGVVGELLGRLLVERVELVEAEVGPLEAPSSTRCSMWIPNGRPQSPMWFSRTTSWPRKSRSRTSASPMTVVRRCPMCISLATFGAE